jgi:glucose-6-phosphate 1-dehydrogenase
VGSQFMEDSDADRPHRPTRKEAIALSEQQCITVGASALQAKGCDLVFIGRGDYIEGQVLKGARQAVDRRLLPADTRIFTVDRNPVTPDQLREDEEHIVMDLRQLSDYTVLRDRLGRTAGRRVIFFLAAGQTLIGDIARGLMYEGLAQGDSILVVEKPVGDDQASSLALQARLRRMLGDDRVVFNDHYLAKQSLWSLAHGEHPTPLTPALWHRRSVSGVQVSTLEDRGIGTRAPYFDRTGLLKDVFCHLMKVVCTLAMEPGRPWADARLEVLRHVRIGDSVRGQYRAANGMAGYLDEVGVPPGSQAETYFGLTLQVDTPRWRGVPWFIEAGKRCSQRRGLATVATVASDRSPLEIPLHAADDHDPLPHARILQEAYAGRTTLWTPRHEVTEEWGIVDRILRHWADEAVPLHLYDAGTDRPAAARQLYRS